VPLAIIAIISERTAILLVLYITAIKTNKGKRRPQIYGINPK
jgi:hypothetical protein